MSDRGDALSTDGQTLQTRYPRAWIGALATTASAGVGLSQAAGHNLGLCLEVLAAIVCIGIAAGIGAGVGVGLAVGLAEAIHRALGKRL